MNTPIFTRAKQFIETAVRRLATPVIGALCVTLLASSASAEWAVDFSRRMKNTRDNDLKADREPAAARVGAEAAGDPVAAKKGLFDALFDAGEPIQDIVLMQTEKGFVPSVVRVRKNGRYRLHVVNVNEKEKNVSFILDGFSEHHATFFGKIKTFVLEPRKEGAYSFISPETSAKGELIVFNPEITIRNPASDSAMGERK